MGERFVRRTTVVPNRWPRRCTVCVENVRADRRTDRDYDIRAPLLESWILDTTNGLSYCDEDAESAMAIAAALALTMG